MYLNKQVSSERLYAVAAYGHLWTWGGGDLIAPPKKTTMPESMSCTNALKSQ